MLPVSRWSGPGVPARSGSRSCHSGQGDAHQLVDTGLVFLPYEARTRAVDLEFRGDFERIEIDRANAVVVGADCAAHRGEAHAGLGNRGEILGQPGRLFLLDGVQHLRIGRHEETRLVAALSGKPRTLVSGD